MNLTYYTEENVNGYKYVLHFHDGERKFKDGSPFYQVDIHTSKRNLNDCIKSLKSIGYVEKRPILNEIREQKLVILSPDGFEISREDVYKTVLEAKQKFDEWLLNYKRQGYYSSTQYGKIDIEDVEDYCTLVEL